MTANRAICVAAVIVLVVAVAGCGGTATDTPATTTTASTETPVVTIPDPTTTTAGTVPRPSGTASEVGTDDLVALGELLYQETAGGFGCQECHGRDASGSVDAPGIVGASRSSINEALGGGIVEMDFEVKLTIDEIGAVATYLQHLATLP